MRYSKEALTLEDQAQRLLDRGLIADRAELIRRLQAVNYYRLSGYLYHYRSTDDEAFQPDTTLEMIWRRYNFDRRLRILLLDAIERIEVAVRTRFVYYFVLEHGAFGHLEKETLPNLKMRKHRPDLRQKLIRLIRFKGWTPCPHAPFEKNVLAELARDFPIYREALEAINNRLTDLHPITREVYYHPSQRGSWSLKAVLPALCPELSYHDLEGVHHGGEAMEIFATAISPQTTLEDRRKMDQQLRAYCTLDTLATVRIWEQFAGIQIPNKHKPIL